MNCINFAYTKIGSLEAIERTLINNDWITLILVFCLILLAVAKLAFEGYFVDFAELAFNEKYLLKTSKNVKFETPFNLLLFGVQLLSVSLFIYLIIAKFEVLSFTVAPSLMFLRIFIFYGLFIGVKYLLEKMTAVLFDGEKELSTYHYYKFVYRNYGAIFLIPINAMLVYSLQPPLYVIGIIIGIVLVFNAITLFNTLRKYEKLIYSNLFYFILYLCAFEIAPYFILFKLLSIDV